MDGVASKNNVRILVVDDEPGVRAILKKLLQLYGYEVTTAVNGRQACELYVQQTFDCVLLDVDMPGIDGYETARRLRRLRHSDDVWTPIIFVTGFAGETSLVRGIDAGADDYLVKPVKAQTLLAKLRAMQRLADRQNRLHCSNRQLERLASQDGLTGLANRRRFDEHLHREWQRQCRFGRTLSLLLIDVDHFKAYNDYFGHQRGDRCLRRVADVLSGQLRRASDLLARYGGEEFAVIMAESDATAAYRIGIELCRSVTAANLEQSPHSPLPLVSVSVGVACMLPRTTQAPARLVEYSDKALYAAKARGRNQVVLFDDLNATASVLD